MESGLRLLIMNSCSLAGRLKEQEERAAKALDKERKATALLGEKVVEC